MSTGLDLAVLLATFAVIFPAELPDKSFVATLVLATRYPRLWVWLGASAAFGIQMVIAVAAGQLLSLLPRELVLGVTAVLFAVGAVMLVRGGLRARDEEAADEARGGGGDRGQGVAGRARPRGVRHDLRRHLHRRVGRPHPARHRRSGRAHRRSRCRCSSARGSRSSPSPGIGVLVGGWLQQRVPLWRIRLVSGGLLAMLAALTVVELVRG